MDPGVGGSNPLIHPIYDMDKELLIEKIKTHVVNNRIACARALKIAEEEKVASKVVGELLNEMGIKVEHCQLGCFP